MWTSSSKLYFYFLKMKQKPYLLIFGDALTLALVTWVGFATHGEAGFSFLPRMLTTYIPLLLGWFLLSPWFGLIKMEANLRPSQLWRVLFIMLFVAPLAATLRGLILNTNILPIFVLILAATNALGILAWRSLYYFIFLRLK